MKSCAAKKKQSVWQAKVRITSCFQFGVFFSRIWESIAFSSILLLMHASKKNSERKTALTPFCSRQTMIHRPKLQ